MLPFLYEKSCAWIVSFFSLEHQTFSDHASRSHHLIRVVCTVVQYPLHESHPVKQSLKCPVYTLDYQQKKSARASRSHYFISQICNHTISPCTDSLRCSVSSQYIKIISACTWRWHQLFCEIGFLFFMKKSCAQIVQFFSLEHQTFSDRASRSYYLIRLVCTMVFTSLVNHVKMSRFTSDYQKISARASRSHYLTSEIGILFTRPRKKSFKVSHFQVGLSTIFSQLSALALFDQ